MKFKLAAASFLALATMTALAPGASAKDSGWVETTDSGRTGAKAKFEDDGNYVYVCDNQDGDGYKAYVRIWAWGEGGTDQWVQIADGDATYRGGCEKIYPNRGPATRIRIKVWLQKGSTKKNPSGYGYGETK